jgi:homogentisate 1,2-dioxygenase
MSPADVDNATPAALSPHGPGDTPALAVEGRWRFHPTAFALSCGALEGVCPDCRVGLYDRFRP